MPSSAARPPAISSTAATGSSDGTGSSDSGTVLAAISAIVPSARMKMMSSGISVFFIQKRRRLRRIVREQHAAVRRQRLAVHQALRLLLGRARDFDREAVRAAARLDRQRHLLEPGRRAFGDRGAAACLAARRRRRAGASNNAAAPAISRGARSSTAVRPLALGAIRASSCWPGLQLAQPGLPHGLHMDEHVLLPSCRPPRLTKP